MRTFIGVVGLPLALSWAVGGCVVKSDCPEEHEREGRLHGRGGFRAHGHIGAKGHGHAKGRSEARATGSGGAAGSGAAAGSGQASAGVHATAKLKRTPVVQISRAKRPPRFVGILPPGGRRPRVQVVRPRAGAQVGAQPAAPPEPIPPPAEPPDNVFGYDRPVIGCFEGQVYFLAENTQALPTSYGGGLSSSSVLYACEWDIPTRDWDQGFPGVADRFEWFAIRYSGAFRVSQAGTYRFRISSDDGAKLTIDDRVVVDNDGVHPPREASGEIELTEGDHTMVLEYFQGPRFLINLQMFVTPPGGEEGLFSVRTE